MCNVQKLGVMKKMWKIKEWKNEEKKVYNLVSYLSVAPCSILGLCGDRHPLPPGQVHLTTEKGSRSPGVQESRRSLPGDPCHLQYLLPSCTNIRWCVFLLHYHSMYLDPVNVISGILKSVIWQSTWIIISMLHQVLQCQKMLLKVL